MLGIVNKQEHLPVACVVQVEKLPRVANNEDKVQNTVQIKSQLQWTHGACGHIQGTTGTFLVWYSSKFRLQLEHSIYSWSYIMPVPSSLLEMRKENGSHYYYISFPCVM